MSDEKVELLRRVIDAVGRGDVEAIQAEVDPRVELHPLVSVWQRAYIGRDGVAQWRRDLEGVWVDYRLELVEWRELDDDTLVAQITWHGTPAAGGDELDGPVAALVRFHEGRATEASFYADLESAERAAGSH